jgi:sigma-54 dependent transcriptional regulator, acetoin dehydrogenase operon transcriptional activator AcoR
MIRTDDGGLRLALQLSSSTLSLTHARLVRDEATWVVEDARSRNGTFVNGERVDRRVLASGDIVEVGRTFLAIRHFPTVGGSPTDVDASDLAAEPLGLRTFVPALAERFAALKRIAVSTVPLLLLGESGTGKEVLSRSVHALSGRTGEFVAVNCGALPSGLVEAQLFGHTKGAFSGATRDEVGFVRSADHGTLLLDEIGELPRTSQTALLRVLQEGEVVPVGSTRPVRVDARIVAASNRALASDDPSFRNDLYARLAGFTFAAPPLRERREDIGLLVADILRSRLGEERAGSIRLAPEVADSLMRYDWPLNIRELEQALCAAAVLAADGVLRARHLPATITVRRATTSFAHQVLSEDDMRLRDAVVAAMTEHRGNIAAVARSMGKAPAQVDRWLKRLRINRHPFRR